MFETKGIVKTKIIVLSANVISNTRSPLTAIYRFSKFFSGPLKLESIRRPLGPGPVCPLVNAVLTSGNNVFH